MRILFVAKHGSGDNDDEGAVAHALRVLGHEVICVHEMEGIKFNDLCGDLCLFFKWENYEWIEKIGKLMPTVLWYFDLVSSNDPTLAGRMAFRRGWFEKVLPHCLLGFCTDGDFVAQDKTGKLRWLMQGMDERVAGPGQPIPNERWPPLLFTGMIRHGQKRVEFINHMHDNYGDKFFVLGDGGPLRRKHGRELANIFASTKIVIAPDGPSTDRYWSNRIYNTLGLGGFLLHPHCQGLAEDFSEDDLVMYKDRQDLCDLIDSFMCLPDRREKLAMAGYEQVMAHHTYRHRCGRLLEEVQRAL